jgi:pimeloyl-ACP methyl ester carboxylesterase
MSIAVLLLLLPKYAAADVPLEKCDVGEGATCGHVDVPLDRSQPSGNKIAIAFAVFRHTDASKPATGTIFVTEGGPGYSALNNNADFYRQRFEPLLDAGRDLVVIDQRGVGRSQALDCQPLQLEPPAFVAAVEKCGQQLGATSDLYGTANVAMDVEAVRDALGIEKFDYYGASYAGLDVQAYAARYPARLRSVVLDSAVNLAAEDFVFSVEVPQIVDVVSRACARSPVCHAGNPNAAKSLVRLIHRLRARPVKGAGRDVDGRKHKLRVTEARVAELLQSDQGGFTNQGEIAAAEKALRHGDKAPLLRLAAENDVPRFHGDPEDPKLYSVAHNSARFCTDVEFFPWDKQASRAERRSQFDDAVGKFDATKLAPFSIEAWVAGPDPCIAWPAPTHTPDPAVPAGTVVPDVPAFIISGDLDLAVPPAESHALTGMFPHSRVLDLKGSGHHTLFNSRGDCAAELIVRFLDTLDPGDTSCAPDAPHQFPGVGEFTRRAHTRAGAARASAAAVTDALRRGFQQDQPDGVGLRGGTYKGTYGDQGETMRLKGARFAQNVAVTGKVAYKGYTTIDARLRVTGAFKGRLRVRGAWAAPGAKSLRVTGRLNGRKVAVSVPAT